MSFFLRPQALARSLFAFGCMAFAISSGAATTSGNGPTKASAPELATTSPLAAPDAAPNTSAAPAFNKPAAQDGAPQVDTGLQPIAPANADSGSPRNVAGLAAPADLWERMRRGFAMPDLDNTQVHEREQWYASRPDYMLRMTERSRKYLFHIVEELERRNMPTELALLPFIESAFNPQAVSSAKAAGMWQFIPSTGKHFDLKQNVFRDDRRDVQASTRAALDYLQKLYGMFGDWQLALAAYNWGEGSVARAIAKNQRAGLGTRYSELNMPAETRQYVPKLQAVKNIVAQPDAFRSSLPDIPNHPYFQSVNITRDIDVALAAQLAEVRTEDFKALNSSASRPVILAAGTPQILLPWDNAAVFESNLQSYKGQLASWTSWVAPSTMKPAEAARRVGLSEASFRSVNGIPPKMLIKAGSTLLAPRAASKREDVSTHVADNGQISLAPELVLRRSTVKARKADTVVSLAMRYKLSAASVAQWNKLGTSAVLKPGQAVVVYLPVRAGRAVARGGKAGSKVARARGSSNNRAMARASGRSIKMAKR